MQLGPTMEIETKFAENIYFRVPRSLRNHYALKSLSIFSNIFMNTVFRCSLQVWADIWEGEYLAVYKLNVKNVWFGSLKGSWKAL